MGPSLNFLSQSFLLIFTSCYIWLENLSKNHYYYYDYFYYHEHARSINALAFSAQRCCQRTNLFEVVTIWLSYYFGKERAYQWYHDLLRGNVVSYAFFAWKFFYTPCSVSIGVFKSGRHIYEQYNVNTTKLFQPSNDHNEITGNCVTNCTFEPINIRCHRIYIYIYQYDNKIKI